MHVKQRAPSTFFLDDWGLAWFKQDTANKNNGKMEPAKMVVLNKDNHDGNVL